MTRDPRLWLVACAVNRAVAAVFNPFSSPCVAPTTTPLLLNS